MNRKDGGRLLEEQVGKYMTYCDQKQLDEKTIKAYRIDLRQFVSIFKQHGVSDAAEVTPDILESVIASLHGTFSPKTVKRKSASLKAFFHYLQRKGITAQNPFDSAMVKFREPQVLPRTIPIDMVESLFREMYAEKETDRTTHKYRLCVRNVAIIEMLFATGMRVSELCGLKAEDLDVVNGNVRIHGKGRKERCIQITDEKTMQALSEYMDLFGPEIKACGYIFVNGYGSHISDQSVRRIINGYADAAAIRLHITPHMFRHTFATSLLENDVDIRYIQTMLGHSSITTTEIYTHVSDVKQREILAAKHPRQKFSI